MASTLIEGGQVIDVDDRQVRKEDLLIEDGLIKAVGNLSGEQQVDRTFNAQGCYLAPGFIDMHCHIFSHPLFKTTRLVADRIGVTQGVACLIDTGSAGPTTIDAFHEFVIQTQKTRTFALVNIGSPGLPNIEGGHASRPELVSLSGTVHAIENNPDWILGVKVLASASHTGLLGIEAVKIGRKAAELTNKPLMVHIGNAPPLIDDVLALLRPGDILTHTYHGKVGGILDYDNKVLPAFAEAVARGIVVDIAHGRSSFSYRTCETALAQGMPVHTISSDLHQGSIDRYVISLARTMSKFRMLGLSLMDVVVAVTKTPAAALGIDKMGFGTLAEGSPAHISIFREEPKEVEVEDAEGERRTTKYWIEPQTVFVDGEPFSATSYI